MKSRLLLSLLLLVQGTLLRAETAIDFNRDIRPLLSNSCFACHGPDEAERSAGLRLDTREGAMEDMGGYAALVPGDAEASELFYRIVTEDEDDLMPPEGKGQRLTPSEVTLIKRWIEQGGEYDLHWSYQKPVQPKLAGGEKAVHPIDHFIGKKLEEKGLTFSMEADRATLARRVSMDLTGLPPTWREVEAFLRDEAPGAYERYVDGLLAKPAYGERWARVWLDLARYADSAGYADDRLRTIWAYRDWVIQALNANQPFDQFTIDQIAGDLLENPTEEQQIATAFHRNTLTNREGGTIDEEFRSAAIVDRVNTTMSVWMGTTMACAQCHTHKYDPLTHAEYFQLYDFFNQTADADRKDESPLHEIWTETQRAAKRELSEEITALRKGVNTQTPELDRALATWKASFQEGPMWTTLVPQFARAGKDDLAIGPDG
ncbi:MAG: DUF1549 domain-containing protein, partial [Verrucomicrobiota bacterium]